MIKEAGKKNLQQLKIAKGDIKPLVPKYEEALKKLAEILEVWTMCVFVSKQQKLTKSIYPWTN